ncbi:MAG: hypothetical protein HY725_07230 [Candidatus Rokubacteria bacterium]|nr:hypothetical protein [Candidatus Rokubacteria bacterium]
MKELAAAVSTQAQVSNRTWTALVTVAVVAVLPRASSGVGRQEVALPLGLGVVDAAWFDLFAFALLVILTIAFSAAHAQQVRAQKLAQNVVDSLAADSSAESRTDSAWIHPRELFDMLRLPSVNRVAPLAQSLRGPYQFYATGDRCPAWLRVVSTGYYAVLKLASVFVYIGVPAWALWNVHSRLTLTGSLSWLATLAALLAGATLLQLLLTDTWYSLKVLQVVWRGTASVPKTRVV